MQVYAKIESLISCIKTLIQISFAISSPYLCGQVIFELFNSTILISTYASRATAPRACQAHCNSAGSRSTRGKAEAFLHMPAEEQLAPEQASSMLSSASTEWVKGKGGEED